MTSKSSALSLFLTPIVLWGLLGTAPSPEPPQVELNNGHVRTVLYLPDATRGYYRGIRFDWAGAFKSLTHNDHDYVSQWFETYNPTMHDAINGPADEFVALGFDGAKPGETFVKIGVGVLRKPDEKAYFFARDYDVVDRGKWTVKRGKNNVAFTHELADPATGYGYRYTKTVRLTKNEPELVLEHSLTNTGQKTIETSTYNHNFWIIDGQPTGPGIEVVFPYAIRGQGQGFGDLVKPTGKKLIYSRTFEKKEYVFSAGLEGFDATPAGYDFSIENTKTGAGVRATADLPLDKLVYWACATTSCPEPYVRLSAAPGETKNWNIRYRFYQK
ncbi:MAG: hypothetical protein EAZ91_03710 [Cytophagales bacterium]|nr:MAG: hypothetical protein EAZ91_03710 [Cytophagales bacterium]